MEKKWNARHTKEAGVIFNWVKWIILNEEIRELGLEEIKGKRNYSKEMLSETG